MTDRQADRQTEMWKREEKLFKKVHSSKKVRPRGQRKLEGEKLQCVCVCVCVRVSTKESTSFPCISYLHSFSPLFSLGPLVEMQGKSCPQVKFTIFLLLRQNLHKCILYPELTYQFQNIFWKLTALYIYLLVFLLNGHGNTVKMQWVA